MKRLFFGAVLAVASLLLVGCPTQQHTNEDDVKLSERDGFRYNDAEVQLHKVESLMQQCEQGGKVDSYATMLAQAKALRYEYNAEGMNERMRYVNYI